jgi:DNA-binding GntR family transcriptional regulator
MGKGSGNKKNEVYSRIKQLILTYRIKPGMKLEHQFLKEEIDVSTTPIREALNRLLEEGYIFQIKNRGFFVCDLSAKELEDLYQVRKALEIFAIKETFRRQIKISQAFISSIRKIITLYIKYAREEPYRDRLTLDRKFHVQLASLCGIPLLVDMLDNVFEKLNYKRKVIELYPQRGEAAGIEHDEMLRFLIDGKDEQLVQIMENHIGLGRERLFEILKAREFA